MRIFLHIGLEHTGADRLQKVLTDKREQLSSKGILFPRSPGGSNHTRLFMAVTDPDHIDPLRYNRGFITADKQKLLREKLAEDLHREVAQMRPDTLILSASQLGSKLHRKSELERLRSLISPLSNDIQVIAHVDEQAALLARIYTNQVFEGRAEPLTRELELTDQSDWWQECLKTMPEIDPQAGLFEETQGAPFWLDYRALEDHWNGVFGSGNLSLRPFDEGEFYGEAATEELRATFDIQDQIGRCDVSEPPASTAEAWTERGRQLNVLLLKLLSQKKKILPRQLWRSFINELKISGEPLSAANLSPVSFYFAADNKELSERHPALLAKPLTAQTPASNWQQPDPQMGYRASQYLLAFMHRIDQATKAEMKTKGADLAGISPNKAALVQDSGPERMSEVARTLMPPLAVKNFEMLQTSPFKPHNRLGSVDEQAEPVQFAAMPSRDLTEGSSGNVIVGCMKNEAPYIIEWVAYHRAIGIDNFLIYTNGCEDGTSEILDRLQEMGVLQHRNNDEWKGNSPQQYALNQSLKEPVIKNADWIIHIDVDEFMNIRCGNGTLPDFLARVPDATNVAMTWRLFGHNGVTELSDDFVTDQFTACAPKFCPKPHTVWGFKTMFKNIGAYQKISCHRPNKLEENFRSQVKWVNGSGKDMTREVADNGWRSSKKSIGYDLIQLNHYALRSAESFLIKRQRGRALHVDRSIGINYWIRMDWCDHQDYTIKRNHDRVKVEYDRLMQDETLRSWHLKGLDWHKAKAEELHAMDEFEELYQQALKVKLTATERVAYALALDMES